MCVEIDAAAQCACEAGYRPAGLECESIPDPCAALACTGQGRCVVLADTARCACDPGHHLEGQTACVPDPDPCAGIGCSDHGTCGRAPDGSALCACEPGYHNQDPTACVPDQRCQQDADCDDANPCTDDGCAAGVCQHQDNTAPCDDGLFCTAGDACAAGACSGGADACPGQVCDEAADACADCLVDADCADPCRSTNACAAGACVQGPVDLDADSDGHLAAACPGGDDCDEACPACWTSHPEDCDGLDNDCDPGTPDGADQAGLGDACDGPDADQCPEGALACSGALPLACDDATGDSLEVCDGAATDEDCDGAFDEEDAQGCLSYYLDADGDGFGVTGDSRCLCAPDPPGDYDSLQAGDCDDADPAVHPGAIEGPAGDPTCSDGVDNDCNGDTDGADAACDNCWWDPAWARRRQLVFDNTGQAEDLIDFPILVQLDAGLIDYAQAGPNGESLRFVDEDCATLLAHEIEAWNPGGTSSIWVKVPRIDANSDTDHIWMYSVSPGAPDAQDPPAVWSAGYEAVYHLHADLNDSGPNGLDGTNNNSSNSAGAIADGQEFDGNLDFVYLGSNLPILMSAPGWTLSAWIRPTSITTNHMVIGLSVASFAATNLSRATLGVQGNDQILGAGRSADGEARQDMLSGINQVALFAWQHIAATASYPTDTVTLYKDGQPVATGTVAFSLPASANTPTRSNAIGSEDDGSGQFFVGRIDEVRIANVARSADWMAAQYLSMTGGFLSFGPEEP